jgi:2'-5' RNA ligase
VVADEALASAALAALEALTGAAPVRVGLCALGLFPGPPGVLFLAPAPTPALLDIHAALIASLPAAGLHPHYRAGAWMPHVTLAEGVGDPAAAVRALDRAALPLAAVLDRLEVVRFRPVTVLARRPLAGG